MVKTPLADPSIRLPGLTGESRSVRPRPLPPIIKWAGGKSRELRHILPALPDSFETYYDPFVGGGAVFFAVVPSKARINDKSSELIDLFKLVKLREPQFYEAAESIADKWRSIGEFVAANAESLIRAYRRLKRENPHPTVATNISAGFIDKHRIAIREFLAGFFDIRSSIFIDTITGSLSSKMLRTSRLEVERGDFTDGEVLSNLESSIRAAFYVHLRSIYNAAKSLPLNKPERTAIFYFIREFCYASMFRYSNRGHFNVPYGGLQYNRKDFGRKLELLKSDDYVSHIDRAEISNLDFLDFLYLDPPSNDDFVFVDPPYDSDFSTYSLNSFSSEDQERLASYLLRECRARFMLVIKETGLIRRLYNHQGLEVRSFDKKYGVSFMDRNDRRTTHLLITNYQSTRRSPHVLVTSRLD